MAIVVCSLSWFISFAAGYKVIFWLAQHSVPAPSGVLCLFSSSVIILLFITLLNGRGIGGFLLSWIPDSIAAYRSTLCCYTHRFILSSFVILLPPCGAPLMLCIINVTVSSLVFSVWFHEVLVGISSLFAVCFVLCIQFFHSALGYSAARLKNDCELLIVFGTNSTICSLTFSSN